MLCYATVKKAAIVSRGLRRASGGWLPHPRPILESNDNGLYIGAKNPYGFGCQNRESSRLQLLQS